jgi:hypothetical protein
VSFITASACACLAVFSRPHSAFGICQLSMWCVSLSMQGASRIQAAGHEVDGKSTYGSMYQQSRRFLVVRTCSRNEGEKPSPETTHISKHQTNIIRPFCLTALYTFHKLS